VFERPDQVPNARVDPPRSATPWATAHQNRPRRWSGADAIPGTPVLPASRPVGLSAFMHLAPMVGYETARTGGGRARSPLRIPRPGIRVREVRPRSHPRGTV